MSETVGSRPLCISTEPEPLVRRALCERSGPGEPALPPAPGVRVHDLGKWGYLEHDWVATAGDFVYEAPGEGTRSSPTRPRSRPGSTFNVTGPLIWLDEDGKPDGTFDVFDYIDLCREHYEKVGLGAGFVDQFIR